MRRQLAVNWRYWYFSYKGHTKHGGEQFAQYWYFTYYIIGILYMNAFIYSYI